MFLHRVQHSTRVYTIHWMEKQMQISINRESFFLSIIIWINIVTLAHCSFFSNRNLFNLREVISWWFFVLLLFTFVLKVAFSNYYFLRFVFVFDETKLTLSLTTKCTLIQSYCDCKYLLKVHKILFSLCMLWC